MTDAPTIVVTATRFVDFNRRSMRPLRTKTEYRCTGPDGALFVNTVKGDLLPLLRRRYPGCKVEILATEPLGS